MTKNVITEKTLVPISLIAALAGGIIWLTTIYANGQSNAGEILELKEKQERSVQMLNSIDRRLGRIEGKLGIPNDVNYSKK